MRSILLFGLAVMFVSAAFAYPTFLGASGTGLMPDAAVANGTEFALDYFATGADIAPDDSYPIRFVFGNGQNFEFYANYFYLQDYESWAVGGKYAFPMGETGAKLALGANFGNAQIEGADEDVLQAYLVGDVPLGENAKASLGVNWIQFQGDFDTDGFRYFVGINAAMSPQLSFIADGQTALWDSEVGYSIALRYAFTPTISGQLGYANSLWNTWAYSDGAFFVGLNFGFGGVAEE